MKEIKGSPKSLKQLLQNTKYTIHYYQREYMWQRKQVEELIDDLTSEFLESYKPGDERPDVQNYEAYFMGSIVLAGRVNAIIDGQQRFSTLTLLLIYLNNRLKKIGVENRKLREMIYSESYGDEGFNIKVEDRIECMDALYNEKLFNTENCIESVKNLYERYNDICEIFPEDKITEDMLLIFCDWLVEKVMFIEIETENDQDAHKIFVTMNDRGLNLTPTEMLKGYLLSEVVDDKIREDLNEMWKDKILKLKKEDKNGDEIFIRDWLRAQYAETMRPRKKGAENKDFEIIAGPFHKWVRDERNKIGLNNSKDFELFLKKFDFYSDIYIKIKKYERGFYKKAEYVYYNAKIDISFQPQLLLAPICYEDDEDTITEKINLVGRFYELYVFSRYSNHQRVGYDYLRDPAFKITKDIRRCSIPELKEKLNNHYLNLEYNSSEVIPRLHLNSSTKKYIKHMLARITGFIEEEIGEGSKYVNYMDKDDKNPFEIEHIISNHYQWFRNEYADQEDFDYWRNRIGALLLLRKSINASLSDAKYPKKLKKYCSNDGNIYSASLGELAYQNTPRFVKFINKHQLKFKTHEESFGKDEIEDRIQLIIQLVDLVWNNDMFIN
jgi:uncharacterized protein with ParB-like and HNH nuclease domain